jgi:hypothetical protein
VKTSLCKLAEKYDCDKTPSIRHGYTPFYHYLFCSRPISRLFEIGIGGGNSLRMWREYFHNASIFGIDNDPDRIFQDEHIHTALCDVSNETALTKVAANFGGGFDVIIDDGSHWEEHQVSAFYSLKPFLSANGLYCIEDVPKSNLVSVSNRLPFPHEIHRFDPHSQFDDDNMIVFFNENHEVRIP